jgi:RNA polymerase sigma-70 factor (ECF subfamily)
LSDEFEAERGHLMAVAYRMLGSRAEAEDAVQECWLRYAAADRAEIRDLRGWLTTATARICLDQLRSARVRREAYVGPWLPEPLITRLPSGTPDPGERVAQADEVGLALMVVMERLTPEQRVAFVLHDVFAVPFEEIAAALGATPAAARQLASRARRAVADGQSRHTANLPEQREVLRAFVAAAESGDITGLLSLLAPDVVMVGDGGGIMPAARKVVTGPERVAALVHGLFRLADKQGLTVRGEPVLINGGLGLLVEAGYPDGSEQRMAMGFAIADGRITAIYDQVNPHKLTAAPPIDPAAPWPPSW